VRIRYGRESFGDLSAYAAVLFMPTMLANGSFWAQCDSIYTSFLLAAVYLFLKNEAVSARKAGLLFVLFFSFSFIFKLQAVFFVLPLCWLYLRGKIQLSYFLILPVVWLLSIFPNYLLGREMLDLMLIYGHQMLYFPLLTLNAPNIYQFFPTAKYADLYKAGLIWTISACVFWTIFLHEKARKININAENLLTLSLISLLLLPFLLPKMHERYFFGADLFSVVWVFFYPKKWYVSVMIVSASFLSYLPFLFGSELFPMWIPAGMMLCATGLTTSVFLRATREESENQTINRS
jgi:Gpi18-like mannosyltransferase